MSTLDTFFLTPDRVGLEELQNSAEYLKVKMSLEKAIDSIDGFVLILNEYRQMVWANDKLADYLNCNGLEGLGLRPGELFQCAHAGEMEAGCGTSWSCQYCGAALAIKEVLDGEIDIINECSILQRETNKAFEFRVKVQPLEYEKKQFLFCVFFDISTERRRSELEQAFVHDIANLAGSVDCITSLLNQEVKQESKDLYSLLKSAANSLVSAVEDHRFLILAEQGELELIKKSMSPERELQSLLSLYQEKISEAGVTIHYNSLLDVDFEIFVIPSLVRRTIENLLKNTIEASECDETVYVALYKDEDRLYFTTKNHAVLSDEVRANMFTRAFSTKGKGRGVGLYSVKLFVENYLDGSCTMQYDEKKEQVKFELTIPFSNEVSA